jgi:hypothetical protein
MTIAAAALGLAAFAPPSGGQAPAAPAAGTQAGWAYTVKMTVDSGGATKPISIGMRQYVTEKNMRMDFDMTGIAGMPPAMGAGGAYMIFNNADTTMTTVMSDSHTAMIMGADYLAAVRDEAQSDAKPKSAIADLGAGETILGHKTHKYRLTTTTKDSAIPAACHEMESVIDMWIAPDIDFDAIQKEVGDRFGSVGGLGDMMTEAGVAQAQVPKGAPLRMIVKSHDPALPTKVLTISMQFSDLTHGPIADSLFTVPAGFQKMDMRSMMTPEMIKAAKEQMASAKTAGCTKPISKP